ncbi:MAG: LytTR family DNA-binding domain-containing protein [Bacteroidota bacterium]
MQMYKTVIVEDEGPARRRLEKMVEKHPSLTLEAALESGLDAIEKIPLLDPDLLLLDIQLKDKTAFEVLEQISNQIKSKIIFITAYDKYAIKAFEVEAVDYLLKPYDDKRFDSAIQRVIKKDINTINSQLILALKESLRKEDSKIVIPEGNKKHHFSEKEVIYIQSDKYYANLHTLNEKRMIRVTLKKLEDILPPKLIRINKSIIINTEFISQIDYQKSSSRIVLKNGKEFFSTKTYNHKLLRIT